MIIVGTFNICASVDDGRSQIFVTGDNEDIGAGSEVGDCFQLVREKVGDFGSATFEGGEYGAAKGVIASMNFVWDIPILRYPI